MQVTDERGKTLTPSKERDLLYVPYHPPPKLLVLGLPALVRSSSLQPGSPVAEKEQQKPMSRWRAGCGVAESHGGEQVPESQKRASEGLESQGRDAHWQ
eukprot:2375975-Rhodomonas_salina.4